MSLSNLRRLISPLVLLLGAGVLRHYADGLQPVYLELIQYAPYVLLAVILALCVYYNRSRLFIATLSLLVVYYLIQTQLQTTLAEPVTLIIYSLISVVHPLSLFILLFIPERGLVNRYGLLMVAGVLVVLFSAALLSYCCAPSLVSIVNNWLPVKPVPEFVLSMPASACYALAVIAGLYRLIKSNDDFAVTTITIALFTFITLAYLYLADISAVMFGIASLSLIMGMMGTSYDMAYRDELTGLLGRRAMNDRLKGLGKQYVIAMMDIDHFKKFNDTHGHDIGDEVLKMVAKQIDAVKGGGTAYRYGGEEFCVVYGGKDIDYCRPFLEQLRKNIEDYRMTVRDEVKRPKSDSVARQRRGRRAKNRKTKTLAVTISIGLAEADDKHDKPGKVLKAADTALYKAKHKGRNCLAY